MSQTALHAAHSYSVASRFGVAAMLGMTTLFGVVFGALRAMGAPPFMYLFLGSMGALIGLAQMRMERAPRAASAVAGAVLLPLWLLIFATIVGRGTPSNAIGGWICTLPFSVLSGALLGYLTGAVMAGVFLVLDFLSRPSWSRFEAMLATRSPHVERAQRVAAPAAGARPQAASVWEERRPVCGVCGAVSVQRRLVSSPPSGAVDLDLRPGAPLREALPLWVQACPGCGCCAEDLGEVAALGRGAAELVSSPEYRQQLQREGRPVLANYFVCASLLELQAGEVQRAAHSRLRAAWACDDAGAEQPARELRQEAAALLERLLEAWLPAGFSAGAAATCAQLADVRRRAGDYQGAMQACDEGERRGPDPLLRAILAFQRQRAAAGDSNRYTLDHVSAAFASW